MAHTVVFAAFEISDAAYLSLKLKKYRHPNRKKPKTTSDTKSKNLLVFFMNTENGKCVTAMNTKTEKPKFFGTKTKKKYLKESQNRKSQCSPHEGSSWCDKNSDLSDQRVNVTFYIILIICEVIIPHFRCCPARMEQRQIIATPLNCS